MPDNESQFEDFSVPQGDPAARDASQSLHDEAYGQTFAKSLGITIDKGLRDGAASTMAEDPGFKHRHKDIIADDPGFKYPHKNIIIDDDGISKHLDRLWRSREVTKEDRQEALDKVHKQLEKEPLLKLLPEADRQAIQRLADAVLTGDTKTLAEVAGRYKGDPERLKAFCKQVEKELKELGAKVNLDVTGDGRMLVYESHGNHAIEVGADGNSRIRAIVTSWDGSVDVLTDREPLRPSTDDLTKQIANGAVRGIRDRDEIILYKEDPWMKSPIKLDPWLRQEFPRKNPYLYNDSDMGGRPELKELMDQTYNRSEGGTGVRFK